MLRKRRDARDRKILDPLMASTLRQQRKAYSSGDHDDDGGTALVASCTIHKCIGLDRRFNPARTIAVIRDIGADVVALQEVDQRGAYRPARSRAL